jgi:hypothetical protein
MKALLLVTVLLVGCARDNERVIVAGLDVSGSAYRGSNPYDSSWAQLLQAGRGGDHIFAGLIDEKGLANGAPVIDFTIRPYSILTDKRRVYDEAVRVKLDNERKALAAALANKRPAKGTDLIGFLRAAGQIFEGFAPGAERVLVVWSDGLQESSLLNLSKLGDGDATGIVERERKAGRLPRLAGVNVYFVTGPSLEAAGFDSERILRLERFWRLYLQASGARLRSYSPILSFGKD